MNKKKKIRQTVESAARSIDKNVKPGPGRQSHSGI